MIRGNSTGKDEWICLERRKTRGSRETANRAVSGCRERGKTRPSPGERRSAEVKKASRGGGVREQPVPMMGDLNVMEGANKRGGKRLCRGAPFLSLLAPDGKGEEKGGSEAGEKRGEGRSDRNAARGGEKKKRGSFFLHCRKKTAIRREGKEGSNERKERRGWKD